MTEINDANSLSLDLTPFDNQRKYKYGIYIHMNKTAGTSQRKIIDKYKDRIKVFDLMDVHNASELYNNVGKMKNCFVWTSVRNPYDRFISTVKGWRSKPVHRYVDQDYHTVDHLLRLANIGHLIEWNLPWLTSTKWYDVKAQHPNLYGTTEFDIMDHLTPMYKFYENFKIFNVPLHFVLKYENINDDWKTVCNALDIKETKLPHANRSLCNNKGQAIDGFKDKINKKFQDYYTEPIHRELIREIYSQDFDLFGYNKDFPELERHPLQILIYVYNKIFNRSPNDKELAQYLSWIPHNIHLLETELKHIQEIEKVKTGD